VDVEILIIAVVDVKGLGVCRGGGPVVAWIVLSGLRLEPEVFEFLLELQEGCGCAWLWQDGVHQVAEGLIGGEASKEAILLVLPAHYLQLPLLGPYFAFVLHHIIKSALGGLRLLRLHRAEVVEACELTIGGSEQCLLLASDQTTQALPFVLGQLGLGGTAIQLLHFIIFIDQYQDFNLLSLPVCQEASRAEGDELHLPDWDEELPEGHEVLRPRELEEEEGIQRCVGYVF